MRLIFAPFSLPHPDTPRNGGEGPLGLSGGGRQILALWQHPVGFFRAWAWGLLWSDILPPLSSFPVLYPPPTPICGSLLSPVGSAYLCPFPPPGWLQARRTAACSWGGLAGAVASTFQQGALWVWFKELSLPGSCLFPSPTLCSLAGAGRAGAPEQVQGKRLQV